MANPRPLTRVVGLSLAALLLAGCATTVRPPLARRSEGLPSLNRGQSSAMVFNGPAVVAAMADTPDWARPEYARNDRHLSSREPRALTAIDEWPQPAPPSIEAQRRTTISRSPQTIIIYGRGAPRGGEHRPGPDRGRQRYEPHRGDRRVP